MDECEGTNGEKNLNAISIAMTAWFSAFLDFAAQILSILITFGSAFWLPLPHLTNTTMDDRAQVQTTAGPPHLASCRHDTLHITSHHTHTTFEKK